MHPDSLWLGRMRGPVRMAMIASIALAIAVFAWLIANAALAEDAIGMFEIVRPRGHPTAWLMIGLIAASALFASIYLSDTKGAIESQPDGFFDIFSLVLSRLAMILIFVIVIVMAYEVVARYVFASPTIWANELTFWIAGFVFLLAGQYAMQQRSHIRIYVVYDLMPRWLQKTSDVMSVFLIVVFTFALVWGGYTDAKRRLVKLEGMGSPFDPPIPATIKPAILIIISLVAIQAISNLIADWNKAPEHHSPMDEIDETEIEQIRRALKED